MVKSENMLTHIKEGNPLASGKIVRLTPLPPLSVGDRKVNPSAPLVSGATVTFR